MLEAWAVLIAADVALFDDLVEPVSDEALALRRGWDRSATRALLDALCATGYVHREGYLYWVDADAGHLMTRAPDFIGPSFGFLRISHHFARYARTLAEGGAAPLTDSDWGYIVQGSAVYTEPAVEALFALVAGFEHEALSVGREASGRALAGDERGRALRGRRRDSRAFRHRGFEPRASCGRYRGIGFAPREAA